MAGIAAEHGIPFMVISGGTRALSDGVELRLDLEVVNGLTFAGSALFGVCAGVAETSACRGGKLNALRDLLQGHGGAWLCVRAGGMQVQVPHALVVSSAACGTGDMAGAGPRIPVGAGGGPVLMPAPGTAKVST